MRLSLLATAAFAALVTARSPFHRHRARDGVEGLELVRINSAHGDIELFPKAIDGGIGWYAKGQDQQNVKVTAPALDEPLDAFTLKVSMGNERKHVGRLQNMSLYKAMHFALMELCPEGRGECFTPEEKYYIEQVDYLDGKRPGEHKTDMKITVTGSSYDGPGSRENRNLRRQLMISAIAGAWEAQSNDFKNCYKVGTEGPDAVYCNIGSPITVNIADQDYITAEIDSKPRGGHFDCVATIEKVRGAQDKSTDEWRRAYHGADLHGIEVVCPNKDIT